MTLQILRRAICVCLTVVAASLFVIASVRAENFPDRTVRLIVPFPAGGSIDTLGRILMEKLGAIWKQSTARGTW